jgi:hypothetical protein
MKGSGMTSRLRAKLTYPHVMSTIAVFLAIGGGTFAVAALKKNIVGPKQIQKNAVRAAEIKSNAAGSSEVRGNAIGNSELADGAVGSSELGDNSVGSGEAIDNSLSGADIDESSLGEVPRAASANASEIVTIPLTKVDPSATAGTDDAGRAAASKVALATVGPFTIYGKCFRNDSDPTNPGVRSETFIQTSSAGAVFDADDDGTGNEFFGPTTPETSTQLVSESSFAGPGNPGTLNISDHDAAPFWAAVENTGISGQLFVGSKVGNPPAGDGVFGPGDGCLFGGTIGLN